MFVHTLILPALTVVNKNKIKEAKDKLLEKANAFDSKVYEEAAKNKQEESSSEETKDDDKKDDNVVDADYEEK